MSSFLNNLIDWVQNLFDPVIDSGRPIIKITNVTPLKGHTLALAFSNGDQGVVDLTEHIEFRGVLSPLQDLPFFRLVQLDHGRLRWPGDITMDPMTLHRLTLGPLTELSAPPPTRRDVSSSGYDMRPAILPSSEQAPDRRGQQLASPSQMRQAHQRRKPTGKQRRPTKNPM